ncbi:hypothetical protein SLS53_008692 [Cytospora paraplurivora]|uniref:Apple domain-containing protein n=1 Tax=Cytospora paraplurivora TaxID=2898453 RepID=A0AAN9YB50_9PEZI
MQSIKMILTTLLAAGALASPFPAGRSEMCNKTPTGPAHGNHAPFLEHSVRTAKLCRRKCEANEHCLSFVFGLPPSAKAPKCLLFTVPGWEVPNQGDDLNVFDRACTNVPAGKPTRHDPIGVSAAPLAHSASASHSAQPTHSAPASESALPTQSAPPTQSVEPTQSALPTESAEPTQSALPTESAPPTQSTASVNPSLAPRIENHKRDASHKSGAAPTSPAGNAPAPLRIEPKVESKKACLDLCKKTTGCKAVEFGKSSPKDDNECRLFEVEAARLPAPGAGQSFKAFDC